MDNEIERLLAELKDRVLPTNKLQEELTALIESHAAERIEGSGNSKAPVWRVTVEVGEGDVRSYLRRTISASQAVQLVLEKHEEEWAEDLPNLTVRATREPFGL